MHYTSSLLRCMYMRYDVHVFEIWKNQRSGVRGYTRQGTFHKFKLTNFSSTALLLPCPNSGTPTRHDADRRLHVKAKEGESAEHTDNDGGYGCGTALVSLNDHGNSDRIAIFLRDTNENGEQHPA